MRCICLAEGNSNGKCSRSCVKLPKEGLCVASNVITFEECDDLETLIAEGNFI